MIYATTLVPYELFESEAALLGNAFEGVVVLFILVAIAVWSCSKIF